MPHILNFKVLVETDEDGFFVASVPAIPGCHSQGKTYEQTITNITEAIELCLEVARQDIKKLGVCRNKTERLSQIFPAFSYKRNYIGTNSQH